MSFTSPIETRPLYGHRVLVPRGGPWGDSVASALRAKGASAVIAPMVNFAPTDDAPALEAALKELAAGEFDWITLTSATTVDVLMAHQAVIPPTTKVACVGETTATALAAAGYKADLAPSEENTAHGLLEEWTAATGGVIPLRVLTLRSQIAVPVLTEGLIRIGHSVKSIVAYRSVGVDVPEGVINDVRAGKISDILVTSGSVAEQIAIQIGDIPSKTLVSAIGPRTAKDAEAFGLRIDAIADEINIESMVDLLVERALSVKP
jgi:uroporphyrinogen-III synthase